MAKQTYYMHLMRYDVCFFPAEFNGRQISWGNKTIKVVSSLKEIKRQQKESRKYRLKSGTYQREYDHIKVKLPD